MAKSKIKSIKAKFILLSALLGITVTIVIVLLSKYSNEKKEVLSSQIQEENTLPLNTVELKGKYKGFLVSWVRPVKGDRISLILNTAAKENMRDFYLENKCKYLSNGGFYTEDDRTLGLFFTNNVLVRNYIEHGLMTGIFSLDMNNNLNISHDIDLKNMKFALQTGPILFFKGEKGHFSLRSDKYARRIVVAIINQNKALFLAIYDKNNSFSGPLLSDLPDILEDFSNTYNVQMESAVNLDGGSASAFVGDEVILEELRYVGSFFCIR